MNPILAAGLHGLIAGSIARAPRRRPRFNGYSAFGAPVIEEVLYRGLLSRSLPEGMGAVMFAADHVLANRGHNFFDVLLGGILYEKARKQYGLLGAIGAHCAHNLAVQFAQRR